MTETDILTLPSPDALLLIGLLLVISLFVRGLLSSTPIPPLLIYLCMGLLLGGIDAMAGVLDDISLQGLGLLGEAGLVLLLFKVGLESDLKGLLRQLPNAFWIWLWNVLISAGLGYAVASWILDFSLLTSAFIAVALSATSLGVTLSLWQEKGQLNTDHGQLLVDVTEMDDVSSIVLMAVAVAMSPVLAAGNGLAWQPFILTLGQVLLTLGVLVAACGLFSIHLERRLTAFVERHRTDHEPMVMILAVGFIIAALAELSGLSLAIGAFLAGLAFSRDTEAAKERVVFHGLYDFFTPFFFIHLGLLIDPDAFGAALWPGLLLLIAAITGKLLGCSLPAWSRLGAGTALLIGVSMVPRAEIALVVMQKGLEAGVAQVALSAMLIVCFGTILFGALLTPRLLHSSRKPKGSE